MDGDALVATLAAAAAKSALSAFGVCMLSTIATTTENPNGAVGWTATGAAAAVTGLLLLSARVAAPAPIETLPPPLAACTASASAALIRRGLACVFPATRHGQGSAWPEG